MSSRRREQILENCRWLFDQEVQIITFVVRKYFRGTPDLRNNGNRGPFESHYYAAVLPKECTLRSLAKTDIEEKILFKEFNLLSTDGAISTLLATIEKKVGAVLEEDPEDGGRIRINTLEVPGEGGKEQEQKQTVKHTINGSLPFVPSGGKPLPSRTASPSGLGLLPPAGTVSSDGVVPPTSPAAQSEVLRLFFESLRPIKNKKSTRAVSQESLAGVPEQDLTKEAGAETGSDAGDELSQLTERNLSLLGKENGRAKTKDLNMVLVTPINPPKTRHLQQRENLFPAPEPKTTFPEVPEGPLKENSNLNLLEPKHTGTSLGANPTNLPPALPSNNSELEQRVAELEEKLRALDTLVKTMQTNPYHFRESSTPTDSGSPQQFPQILTPTTSVASDTTIPSRRVSMQKEASLSDVTRELIKAEIKLALGQGQPRRSKRRTGRPLLSASSSVPSSAFGSESEA